mmetsp:Transcript_43295/g.97845  ORF Transcript_43295/g.97845 Transcript_43295/m.97845 type:complete len:281 (-) Transcript_43295:590-1432(-)
MRPATALTAFARRRDEVMALSTAPLDLSSPEDDEVAALDTALASSLAPARASLEDCPALERASLTLGASATRPRASLTHHSPVLGSPDPPDPPPLPTLALTVSSMVESHSLSACCSALATPPSALPAAARLLRAAFWASGEASLVTDPAASRATPPTLAASSPAATVSSDARSSFEAALVGTEETWALAVRWAAAGWAGGLTEVACLAVASTADPADFMTVGTTSTGCLGAGSSPVRMRRLFSMAAAKSFLMVSTTASRWSADWTLSSSRSRRPCTSSQL